jgi:hypothetical protein
MELEIGDPELCFPGVIFFCANLTAGWRAATAARLVEFAYRGVTSGFYGAITQAFRRAEPPWLAGVVAGLLLPLLSHSLEFGVHVLRGTPKLRASLISSLCFTALSTTFNLYAMRRGALLVCSGAGSLIADLRVMPRLVTGFLAAGPLAVQRWLKVSRLSRPTN